MGFVNPASPGWGLGWVCLGTVCGVVPLVSAVCGVRGWASVSACFWDVCGFVGAPLAPRRFRFRRAVWACVLGPGLGCAQPFLAGSSGCVFCAFVFSSVFLFFFFFRAVWSLSLHPLSFELGWWFSFFFFPVSVSLFPAGRCYWLGVRDADSQRIQFGFAEFAANSFAARIRCEFGLKFLVLRIRGEFALRIRRRRQNDHACAVFSPDEKLTLNCVFFDLTK